jgi:hypothetical protein
MVDTIRAVATYLIAFTVVVGGGIIIYATRNDPASRDVIAIFAGFIGSALTFVFGSEVQTRTARQAASATYAATLTNGAASTHDAQGAH